jgi:peptidoglycan/LPS O-acetylase OafA/YrhL
MSETVLNAVGTSAAGTVPTPRKSIDLKYFDWLYIFIGIAILIFGPLTLYFPDNYEDVWTVATNLNTTDVAILALLGVLIAIFGFLDYRNTKSKSNKLYYIPIIIILGIALIPLYTYYGAFNGLLGNNYDLSGLSMAGILLVFAGLGEIYLIRRPSAQM